MTGILDKILSALRKHKKKSLTGVFLLALYITLRYMKRNGKFEQILNKMSERVTKQIEENLKQTDRIRKLNANFEDMYNYYQTLLVKIRKNLQRDIEGIFSIDKLRQLLKSKEISSEERKVLWNDFKSEVFLHASFSLLYIPIAKIIVFIRECVINKNENTLENISERDLRVLENFFSDFTEFIIRNAGKFLYSFLREKLSPIFAEIEVTKKYEPNEILNIFNKISDSLTETTVKTCSGQKNKSKNREKYEMRADTSEIPFTDIKNISQLLTLDQNRKLRRNQKTKSSSQLMFPSFELLVVKKITQPFENYCLNKADEFFENYYKNLSKENEYDEQMPKRSDNNPVVINLEEDRSKPNQQKERSILDSLDHSNNAENKSVIIKAISDSTNEFLDLIESGNFNLLLLYAIKFEFQKLINRIALYFQKNKTE